MFPDGYMELFHSHYLLVAGSVGNYESPAS